MWRGFIEDIWIKEFRVLVEDTIVRARRFYGKGGSVYQIGQESIDRMKLGNKLGKTPYDCLN